MKYLYILPKLTVLLMIFQSCNSQNVKLENINFTEKVSLILNNSSFDIDKTHPFFPGMNVFETRERKILQYYNINLDNTSKDVTEQNRVYFATEEKDSIIKAMLIVSHGSKICEEILNKIEEKFGKGKIFNNDVVTLKNGSKYGTVNYLWEDNQRNITFLLNYNYTRMDDLPHEEVYFYSFKNDFQYKSRIVASYSLH